MAEKTSEAERIKPTTLTICAIISIVLAFIISFQGPLLPAPLGCAQSLGSPIMMTGGDFPGWPMVALLVITALWQIPGMRKYLTGRNLAYLFVTLVSCAMVGGVVGSNDQAYLLSRYAISESFGRYLPEFVTLPTEAALPLINGVGDLGRLPWNSILPAIIWRFLMFGIFSCITIGVANIFRREWIEIEKIPFPYTLVYHTCLVNVENIRKRDWPMRTPFLLGLLAGFILCLPIGATYMFPWFPDIYSWKTNTCGPGSHWFAPPGIPWHLGINKHPTFWAFMLVIPVHYLFSTLFYLLVFEIAIFVSYAAGYYTEMTQYDFCGRNWCAPSPYVSPPIQISVISTGALIGIFISMIVYERRYIAETLKAAFSRSSSRSEFEGGEPMSYRSSWIMVIASFILMMIFFIYTGLSPWLSFVVPFAGIVTWIVTGMVWGRVGFAYEPCYDLTPAMIRIMAWPTQLLPEINSVDYALVPLLSREHIGHYAAAGFGSAFYASVLSYKMADLAKINSRDVFKLLIVSLFPALFVYLLCRIAILPGLYGARRIGYELRDFQGDIQWNFWYRPVDTPISEATVHLLIGFIIVIIGRYLYTKLLWFPDPIVAPVSWAWGVSLWGAWVPILVALIVKNIVLRMGGSKLYEEKVVPFASGVILGEVLEVLTLSILAWIILPRPII